MKYILIVTVVVFCFAGISSAYITDHKETSDKKNKNSSLALTAPLNSGEPHVYNPRHSLKNVWKINQLYYDSLAAEIDSSMANFRLLPTDDSILYLHDGTNPHIFYWNLYESSVNKLSVYADKNNMSASTLILSYDIIYADATNLILRLDMRGKNLPIETIEYRLIPDPAAYNTSE